MTDEQPPEGMETKDVHTMSGGTTGGAPGYRPAGVPNADVTNAPAEQSDAGADETESAAAESDSSSGSASSSSRKTTSRSSGGSSKS